MRTSWLIVLAALVVSVVLVGGCGGHGGVVPPGGGGAGVAAFVGRTVCAACHGDIDAAFGSYWDGTQWVPYHPDGTHKAYAVWANFRGSAHGQDMRSKGPNNRNVQDNVGCQPCHTVGWQEDTGFTTTADTPHLEGIGCEECHGKGSLHAGDPSPSNINRTPDAATTCWDCHVGSYKLLRAGQPPTVTDANPVLYNVLPKNVRAHQRQAPFLNGYLGYNYAQFQPSPHANVPNTCVTCHLNPNSAEKHGTGALDVDFGACGGCHPGGPVAAQNMLEDFEEEINDLLIELGGDNGSGQPNSTPTGGLIHAYAVAHGIDDGTPPQAGGITDPDNPFVKVYKAARYNYDHVEASGPWHNPPFAEQLLQDAKAMVD